MNPPRVSVLLPFRNAESTLSAAIDSIRAQTFQDWEAVLFDDGSTDCSRDIALAHASGDRRIRLIQSPHQGLVSALQRACDQARAPFLARMDADDVAHPDRLQRQLDLIEDSPALGLCGTLIHMTGPSLASGRKRYERWINRLITHDAIVRELFVECPIAHPTFLLRRSWFETVGGYRDSGWAEDYDLCMRLWLAGARFAKVNRVLLEWQDRPNRLSMCDPRYSLERFRALKRHYLAKSYLKMPVTRTFLQWGAGEVGKVWLREWEDPRPTGVIDVHPRKVGKTIHDTPVIAPEALPPPGKIFVVIAVGAPGARKEIREWLDPRGYIELEDYLFLA